MEKCNKETIIESIQQFVKENNKIPKTRDFINTKGKYPSYATVRNYFGSWDKGIKAAGFIPNRQYWTKENIIKSIQRFYKENNNIPSYTDFYKTKGKYPDRKTVQNNFSSWNKAIEAAGFEPYIPIKIWNKENIIEAIQGFYKVHKVIPQYRDFEKTNGKYPSNRTVVRYFSSWNKGIEAAGFKPNIRDLYGTPTKANDNITYRSKYEAEFVNKFLFNKYKYTIEPAYPKQYNKYYDWYLPELNIYVELDGELRPEIMKEKIEINKLLNRNLLVIKTKDINKYATLEGIINVKRI